jgi:hypothetical protein
MRRQSRKRKNKNWKRLDWWISKKYKTRARAGKITMTWQMPARFLRCVDNKKSGSLSFWPVRDAVTIGLKQDRSIKKAKHSAMSIKDTLYYTPVDNAIPLSGLNEDKRMMDGNT